MSPLLFAYGSNMADAEMAAFAPEARYAGPARLPDHRLELRRRSIRWGGGAADVVAAPGEEVWGVVYELPEDALVGLDTKEGAGHAYRRRETDVDVGGKAARALVYEVVDKESEEVPCTAEYAALVLGAAAERGLPEEYLRGLERRLTAIRPHAPGRPRR